MKDFNKLREAEKEYKKERKLPHDFTLDEIPTSSRLWLLEAGIDDATRRTHGIGYSQALARTIIPVKRSGVLVGSIARRDQGSDGPKYISNVPPYSVYTVDRPGPQLSKHKFSVDSVIVEDALSAIRVGRFVRTVALLGTGASDAYLGRVLAELDGTRIGIWLDPDNAGRSATRDLVRGLNLAGKSCKLIESKHDPKKHSDREIQEYLA